MAEWHTHPDLNSLQTHDHACSIYKSSEDQKRQFVPYLQAGLLLAELCIYFVDCSTPVSITKAMQENGFGLKPYLEQGAFLIINPKDAYLKEGHFNTDKMIAYWAAVLEKSEKDGFTAVRVASEMTWALSGMPGCEYLTTYEAHLNKFTERNRISFMCQYHIQEFSADKLKDIIQTHPFIVSSDTVLENPTHVKLQDSVPDSLDVYLQATLNTLMMAKKLRQKNEELATSLEEQKHLHNELHGMERERRKRELAEAEKRQYQLIAEAIPQVVWTATSAGVIDYLNPHWYRYTGMSTEDTQNQGWVNALHPDERPELLQKWRYSFLNGEPYEEEFRFRASDGSYHWHQCRAVPLYDKDGNIVKWFGGIVDIEDHKKLTTDLAVAIDQAQKATDLKSIFLANMSHEIRTPMNAIMGMCNLLLKTDLNSLQLQFASNIKQGASALLTVINDILDFSKVEAGKMELELVDFKPVDIVESTCEFLAASARSKQLSLMSYVDPAIPDQLYGDPERLRQILINLTSNAIKFSEHGEIIVRADFKSAYDDIVDVRFSVIDQGIGMSSEVQSRLFKSFGQADESVSRKFGGTGLGLSICKGLVELMNGAIGTESSTGQGSTFWFVVPLKRCSKSTRVSLRDDLRNLRILIVDDQPQARQILDSYVHSWGMRAVQASSVDEALDVLRQAKEDGDPFRIAIINFELSEKNGIELGKEILGDSKISAAKLILLTAIDTDGLGTQAVEAGFTAYVIKPVRQSQLLESIIGVLSDSHTIVSSLVADVRGTTKGRTKRDELILIAEDYPINQQVAQLYLNELGFDSHVVCNGKEAIESIKKHNYALVLMDCQMPEMDGFAATNVIRNSEAPLGQHIPIIAMTAYAMSSDRERCLAAGMDDYISKPVDPDLFKKIIDKWLPLHNKTSISPHKLLKSFSEQIKFEEPVNLKTVISRYGDTGQKLLQTFLQTAPEEITKMQFLIDNKQYKDFLNAVHGFKGVCGTIFADKMRSTCVELERVTKDAQWSEIPRGMHRLKQEWSEVQEFLKCNMLTLNQ